MLLLGLASGGSTCGVLALAFALALGLAFALVFLAISFACLAFALACSLARFSSAFALALFNLLHYLTILLKPFFSKTYVHHISTQVVTLSESALNLVVNEP